MPRRHAATPSRSSQSKPLLIDTSAMIIIGLDVQDAILLAHDADPVVGDGDDIVELLAAVDGNYDLTPQ